MSCIHNNACQNTAWHRLCIFTFNILTPMQGATPVAVQTLVAVGTLASSIQSPGDWKRLLQSNFS
jgi:hypothetical protein